MTERHRDGAAAREIFSLQHEDGSWGDIFHTLSEPTGDKPLTTEQALRRLHALGFTLEDEPIQRAVGLMISCLKGERKIDDYWEKTHDWALFTQLMLSAWVRVFDPQNEYAVQFALRWRDVIIRAFEGGEYDHRAYLAAYTREFGAKPKGKLELDFVDFYHIRLLYGLLPEDTEDAFLRHLIAHPKGICYICSKPVNTLPQTFMSKETERFLTAVDLLSGYRAAKRQLSFAADWLEENRDESGQWDLGPKAKDNIYLPLSDSWRDAKVRKADCTERVRGVLMRLK